MLVNLPIPTCAKCGRPVEELTVAPTDRHHIRSVIARCHGELDVCEIDLIKFNPAEVSVVEAVAFKSKEGEL